MKKVLLILLVCFIGSNGFSQGSFLSNQRRYQRVRAAIADKEQIVLNKLNNNNIDLDKLNILIIVYKDESKLEIFAKNNSDSTFNKIAVYDICRKSGDLGPKRMEGDLQVPEGFYYINRFNPSSNFYLSLGINYPNKSDRIKSNATSLGGDIFIHGSCVTIGCMPMTDDKIKEIYLYAVYARNNGQKRIPVYIFPFRMTTENFEKYKNNYGNDDDLIDFWTNLKIGYDKFEKERKELHISISKTGDYIIE